MSVSYNAIYSRLSKAIKNAEARENQAGVYLVEDGNKIDHLTGLVVIMSRRKHQTAQDSSPSEV